MGTLYLVATPIGNLEDITIRAIKTLFSVDYIACEDTRKTGQLIKNLGLFCHPDRTASDAESGGIFHIPEVGTCLRLSAQTGRQGFFDPDLIGSRNDSAQIAIKKPKFISYYDEIEFKRVPEIVEILKSGKSVALISNAGTPLIADPGYKLVKECIKKGIKVVSIPGPSSVITALVSSGLPCDQFLFLGYLPKTKSKRIKLLKEVFQCFKTLKRTKPTIVFLETPHRLNKSLSDIKEVFGNIEIVIARELTKLHEEIWRGKISETKEHFNLPKGEFVILFTTQFV